MKTVPVWVYYSIYRLLLFIVPLAILLVLRVNPIAATVIAAIVGLCLSYIFLGKPRDKVARNIYSVRHRASEPVRVDDAAEDAAVDARTEANGSEGERETE